MFFGTVERPPRLSEFEFEIPEKLIAQNPTKTRGLLLGGGGC